MKKVVFSAVMFLAALCTTGCAKDTDVDNDTQKPTEKLEMESISFEAESISFEAESDDKELSTCALLDNLLKVFWQNNDTFALDIKSNTSGLVGGMASVENIDESDESKASFIGSIAIPKSVDTYFAAYPYSDFNKDTRINPVEENVRLTILAQQSYPTSPLMVAKCENVERKDVRFSFKQATSALKICSVDTAVDRITFEGNNGESICGSYLYDYKSGAVSVTGTGKTISYEPKGQTSDLVIIVPAMTFANGYKVTYYKGEEKMVNTFSFGKSVSFEKGLYYDIKSVVFAPLTVTLGEVKSSYENPTDRLPESTIYTSENTFAGMSNTLVREVGIICGSLQYPATGVSKSFSVGNIVGLASDVYDVRAYVIDNSGVMYTSESRQVGVVGDVQVSTGAVRTSYTADGAVSPTNDVAGNIIKVDGATYSGISPRLVAKAGFEFGQGGLGVEVENPATTFATATTALAQDQWQTYDGAESGVRSYIVTGKGDKIYSTVVKKAVVSGIPYSIHFDGALDGWSWTNAEWWQGAVSLKSNKTDSSRGFIVTPKFNVAVDTNVETITKAYAYTSLAGQGKCNMYVAPVANTSSVDKSSAIGLGLYISYPNTNGGDTYTRDMTLSAAKPHISIGHDQSTGTWQTRSVVVHDFEIRYK